MHYHAEIWIPELKNIDAQITEIMQPYYEGDGDNEKGFWDWWQIGGRWTGVHCEGYDPAKDPDNIEICPFCEGTGLRNDGVGVLARDKDSSYTCNSCGEWDEKTETWKHSEHGQGKRLKWPTQFKRYHGDVLCVTKIATDLSCCTLIVNGQVFHTEIWNGKNFVKTDFDGNVRTRLEHLKIKDGYLVTVDYHT